MRTRRFVSALLTVGAVCAATASWAAPRPVEGTVTYRERIAVPSEAVLEVEVLDVSLADAPSVRMASQRYALDKVPFEFALNVDDALINDRNSYTVAARILVNDKVLYRSTTAYPVLTGDASDHADIEVEFVLVKPTDTPGQTLVGTWEVTELQGSPVAVDMPPALTFTADGGVSAFGGCNRFNGKVDITGDAVTFPDHMAGTMKACPEPVSTLERTFLRALPEVVRFEQADNLAVLFDASNDPVMLLIRE